ncbi:hypothetical protein D8I30_03350 [Brevundimonas naejangsanensis]|uniref:Lipoprotein n=1 Tax=Brevundimonas naejangsanensis TaxID=588932 RepID=A0A494RDD7_9CAUL|nr:hypothetical protein [Brevundimonas naejangsanensis]AYG94327.1 hypothetical protein D8I30_03350 [Brevundimonas naejangsanensis]
MRTIKPLAMAALLGLGAGCGQPSERRAAVPAVEAPPSPPASWRLTTTEDGRPMLQHEAEGVDLSCRDGRLSLAVGAFHVVSSEERMSLGAGEDVTVLVVGVTGSPAPSRVVGVAPLAGDPARILASGRPLHVNYGYQNAGPITAPQGLAEKFLAACAA